MLEQTGPHRKFQAILGYIVRHLQKSGKDQAVSSPDTNTVQMTDRQGFP